MPGDIHVSEWEKLETPTTVRNLGLYPFSQSGTSSSPQILRGGWFDEELDGRVSKALTMLNKSRDDMHSRVSKAGGGITSLQISGSIEQETLSLPETANENSFALQHGMLGIGFSHP